MMLQRFFVYFVGLAGICFANSLHVKRDTCQPQPTGAGPVPSPDTADNFLNGPVPAVSPNHSPLVRAPLLTSYAECCQQSFPSGWVLP